MSGGLTDPNTLAAIGQTLADLDRRLRTLEARDGAGTGATAVVDDYFVTQSSDRAPSGPAVTVTPGPSGRVLVIVSGFIFPGGGPDSQEGLLGYQWTPTGQGTQVATDYGNLILHKDSSSKVSVITGLDPGVPVLIESLAWTINGSGYDPDLHTYANPMNFANQALIALPL